MDPQLRAHAEARLEQAAAALGLADPRPPYRERLRTLRETHADAFDRAIRHYEETVLPVLANGDPLAVWLDYGRFLAGLTAEGDLKAIDATGRAHPCSLPLSPNTLVLFVPTDNAAPVLLAAAPVEPTQAQRATIDLLVGRKLGL